MTDPLSIPATAFDGVRLLSAGPLVEVALAVKNAAEAGAAGPLLAFDDANGRVIDLDLRGSKAEIIARLQCGAVVDAVPARSRRTAADGTGHDPASEPRGRGRPKLGVVGREVTLLPRHWEWLAAEPGGASVALRRLVDAARKNGGDARRRRAAQETTYRFMSALAGDLPGFEEATRALFADDRARFERHTADWPADVRAYATRLAFPTPADGAHAAATETA